MKTMLRKRRSRKTLIRILARMAIVPSPRSGRLIQPARQGQPLLLSGSGHRTSDLQGHSPTHVPTSQPLQHLQTLTRSTHTMQEDCRLVIKATARKGKWEKSRSPHSQGSSNVEFEMSSPQSCGLHDRLQGSKYDQVRGAEDWAFAKVTLPGHVWFLWIKLTHTPPSNMCDCHFLQEEHVHPRNGHLALIS